MNSEEKKVIDSINKLKPALKKNDQQKIVETNKIIDTLDASKVRQSLLDDLDELFEHDNYRSPN